MLYVRSWKWSYSNRIHGNRPNKCATCTAQSTVAKQYCICTSFRGSPDNATASPSAVPKTIRFANGETPNSLGPRQREEFGAAFQMEREQVGGLVKVNPNLLDPTEHLNVCALCALRASVFPFLPQERIARHDRRAARSFWSNSGLPSGKRR